MNKYSQRGIAHLLLIFVLLAGLAFGVYLVQTKTNLFSRASYDGGSQANGISALNGTCITEMAGYTEKKPCGATFTCADGYKVSIGGTTFTVGSEGGTFIPVCKSLEDMRKEAQKICDQHAYCSNNPTNVIAPTKNLKVECDAPNQLVKLTWVDSNNYTKKPTYKVRYTSSVDSVWDWSCDNAESGRDNCLIGGSSDSPSLKVNIVPGTRYEFSVAPLMNTAERDRIAICGKIGVPVPGMVVEDPSSCKAGQYLYVLASAGYIGSACHPIPAGNLKSPDGCSYYPVGGTVPSPLTITNTTNPEYYTEGPESSTFAFICH